MSSLAQVIAHFDPNQPTVLPPNWGQGRTIYGGISTALSLEAVRRATQGALPAVRSVQIAFVGPATDALRFVPKVLRQGRSVTTVGVDCLSGEEISLRATFVFADPRESRIVHELSHRPQVDGPEAYPSVPALPMLPAFLSNFEVRFAGKSLPVSGSDNPELIAWVRHRDATGVDPAVAVLALADCLPPATMVSFTEFKPASSVTWSVDFARPAVPGEWFLLRSSSQRAAGGYSYQTMEIWDEQGAPVASGSQTVAIFV